MIRTVLRFGPSLPATGLASLYQKLAFILYISEFESQLNEKVASPVSLVFSRPSDFGGHELLTHGTAGDHGRVVDRSWKVSIQCRHACLYSTPHPLAAPARPALRSVHHQRRRR